MNKFTYNRSREVKTAKKRKEFRAETEILFSSSDRYNDSYRCVVTARRIRDRFVVSLLMNHEPVQSTVYTNFWIYNTQDKCREKYEKIVQITEDIRDFVEAEGLKTVVAQHMLRHSLSAISADVENMYETAIPYIRTVIDKSSRGNLLKNIPFLPFRTQSGPDKLNEVYTSVGTAKNPVPDDKIPAPSIYQHLRENKGLADVLPDGMSDFQKAAGLGERRASSAPNTVKTAQLSEKPDGKALLEGKQRALGHLKFVLGFEEEKAGQFYDSVKELCSPKPYTQLSMDMAVSFLTNGLAPSPVSFNRQDKRIAKYLGIPVPIRMLVSNKPKSSRDTYTLVIDSSPDIVFFDGDLDNAIDPEHKDFDPDPYSHIYSAGQEAECKTTSMILAMSATDLAMGPERVLEKISKGQDWGRCEALFPTTIPPEQVAEVIAWDEDSADLFRKVLDKMGKMIAVSVEEPPEKVLESKPCIRERPPSVQAHFQVSDRVTTKPRLNNPSLGTITNVATNNVSVQWDSGERHIYDLSEALMRLAPISPEQDNNSTTYDTIVYELTGMDDESALLLASLGIDPVDIYSAISHAALPVAKASGWEGILSNTIHGMGLSVRPVMGFKKTPHEKTAFSKSKWMEGRLPDGNRLIIDIAPDSGHISVVAGHAHDYIVPSKNSIIFE